VNSVTRLLGLVIIVSGSQFAMAAEEKPLIRIAFSSCAAQDRPQPIWDAVVANKPQLFLFLGDNIYADTEDMKLMWTKYQKLAAQPGFQRLKKTCPVMATWDDHDYGASDAGVEYPKKKESQQLFLDFFGVAADSSRRQQHGIYHSRMFGPQGKRVHVILLDTRYFRSPLKREFERGDAGEGIHGLYIANTDPQATMLGEMQWHWLEHELAKPAELRIIASSIQVISQEHGWESWSRFPHERKRLFQLLRKTKASGVILVSGDRHRAEFSKSTTDIGYPLFDVTAGSLNRGERWTNEVNFHRVGLTYFETNFGMLIIDWNADPLIRLQVRDEKGNVVLQQSLHLSQLQSG